MTFQEGNRFERPLLMNGQRSEIRENGWIEIEDQALETGPNRSGNTVSGKRCRSRRRWELPTLAARALTRRPRSIVMLPARTGRGVVRRRASSSRRTRGDARDLDLSWYSRREPGDVSRVPRVVVPLHARVMANSGEVRARHRTDDGEQRRSPPDVAQTIGEQRRRRRRSCGIARIAYAAPVHRLK